MGKPSGCPGRNTSYIYINITKYSILVFSGSWSSRHARHADFGSVRCDACQLWRDFFQQEHLSNAKPNKQGYTKDQDSDSDYKTPIFYWSNSVSDFIMPKSLFATLSLSLSLSLAVSLLCVSATEFVVLNAEDCLYT